MIFESGSSGIQLFFRTQYWRDPFQTLCQSKRLNQFYVVDVEDIDFIQLTAGCSHLSTKHRLADIWVVPSNQVCENFYIFCYNSHSIESSFLFALALFTDCKTKVNLTMLII